MTSLVGRKQGADRFIDAAVTCNAAKGRRRTEAPCGLDDGCARHARLCRQPRRGLAIPLLCTPLKSNAGSMATSKENHL